MAPKPQPDREVEPVVQRLRLRYAKRGRLRFSSHRDFQRAFERAVRRAGVPIAFSAGFSPHPKISYANAAPTGIGSEAEYLEIGLARACDPQQVCHALQAAMPEELPILEAVEVRTGDFAERLAASVWHIELPDMDGATLETAVATLLAAPAAEVTRMTKQGLRTFDARHAIVDLSKMPDSADGCAILRVVVRHTTPAVRPDDVLQALASVGSLGYAVPPRVTRLAQGPLDAEAGDVGDPLLPDRS